VKELQEKARQNFAEHGYKWTGQRKEIVSFLAKESARHMSAEDLHALMLNQGYDIGLATVYRTLELMVNTGLVHKLQFGDGCSRYEVADDDHHHHHLVCNACSKVYEVSMDLLEELEHKIEVDYDFRISGHHLKFYGICSACKKLEGDD